MPAAWSHGFGGQGKVLPSRIHFTKNRESDPYTQDFARWIPNQAIFSVWCADTGQTGTGRAVVEAGKLCPDGRKDSSFLR